MLRSLLNSIMFWPLLIFFGGWKYPKSKLWSLKCFEQCVLYQLVFLSPYFSLCCSIHTLFKLQAAVLRQEHRFTPKWHRTLQCQMHAIHVHVHVFLVSPNFSPFRSTACPFWTTGHFNTSAPNDPKMILNTTRSTLPPHTPQCPRPPNFIPFHPMTSHFRVTGHFDTSAPNSPKSDLEHYKVKCTPYMCY